ncbi:MAG: alpha/beta fold hydrolase [Gemmataceae bacterium]
MKWMACVVALAVGAQVEDARLTKAKAMLDALNKGEWEAAGKHFDKTMKEKMPPDKTRELWEAVTKQVGAFKKLERTDTVKFKDSNIVDLTCQFDKVTLKVRISFDKDDQVEGFFLRPATAPKFDPPPYAKKDAYREDKLVVGEGGDWPLGGTLTLPAGEGPFPCVVLVQGSGPHDRDETIGPNKPFRDLAWGLATQGVASLRYDKRTHAHGMKMLDKGKITLDDEVTDDALAAAKALRARKEIDPKRVFIVGHSLGAFVAPRLGERDPGLAGLVLLAGNSRPLEDLVIEQFTYIYSLDGGPTEKQKEELAQLKKKVAKVKGKLADDAPAKELPLGLPVAYWKSLNAYDQTGTAAKLTMPILVLQGERDYQVTMADFAGWKKAMAGRKSATLKSYPAMNHLFMTGKGQATPAEYGQAGHVAKEVIDDIAAWVKGVK